MNEAFRLLFDQVQSGIVWAQRDGKVRYANKAAVQLTPCMLGQTLLDPVADRAVKDAGKGLLNLPYRFSLRSPEQHADQVSAMLLQAPVGNDLMLVLNNMSKETWFDQALGNMFRYIQAEMALPLIELSRDLQALPQQVSATGANAIGSASAPDPTVAKVATNARAMAMKLGRLNELVEVFGAGAIRSDERVVLNDLVKTALHAAGKAMDERNVTVTPIGLDVDLTVYGSATWLARALTEFVLHIVHAARGGSRIDLALQASGNTVLLRSRDMGLFITSHARRASQVPFSAGDGVKAAQPRIGLALARSIIEQHGGKVRVEDTNDSVDFVMELPAGAPDSTQQKDLGELGGALEQAQRYAHDMARLMERQLKNRADLKSLPG